MQYDMQVMRPETMQVLIAKQFATILSLRPEVPEDRAALRREVARLRMLYEMTIAKIRSVCLPFGEDAVWQGELAVANILFLMARVELATWEACQHGRAIDLMKFLPLEFERVAALSLGR